MESLIFVSEGSTKQHHQPFRARWWPSGTVQTGGMKSPFKLPWFHNIFEELYICKTTTLLVLGASTNGGTYFDHNASTAQ